jgi:hypothetical protein
MLYPHSRVVSHSARSSAPALLGHVKCTKHRCVSANSVRSQQEPLQQDELKQQQQQQLQQQEHHHSHHAAAATTAGAVLALTALQVALPDAASALAIRMEPANALSLPTWAIHVSSVTEWVAAMALMWKYAEVSGNPRWKGMTWGMMPCLGSAMAACTWHFFYNSPE